jgi:hypothetical protein
LCSNTRQEVRKVIRNCRHYIQFPTSINTSYLQLYKLDILLLSKLLPGLKGNRKRKHRELVLENNLPWIINSHTVWYQLEWVCDGRCEKLKQDIVTLLHIKVKSKAIPVTSLGRLQVCEMLRIPHCLQNWLTDGRQCVSPMHRLLSTPQKHNFSASGTHVF